MSDPYETDPRFGTQMDIITLLEALVPSETSERRYTMLESDGYKIAVPCD